MESCNEYLINLNGLLLASFAPTFFFTELDRDYISCCGANKLIDIRQEFCCGKEPRKRNLETDCCGETVFTPKTQNCLTSYDSEKNLHHHVTSQHELLCGKEIYSIRKQGCCSGTYCNYFWGVLKINKAFFYFMWLIPLLKQ